MRAETIGFYYPEYVVPQEQSCECIYELVRDTKGEKPIIRYMQDHAGVRRIIPGTTSDKKFEGWVENAGTLQVDSCEQIGIDLKQYQEPPYSNVLKVSDHKVDWIVDRLHRKPGGRALVVAADTLTGKSGEVLHKLNRDGSLKWEEIETEIENLSYTLAVPSTWVWLVGVVQSARDIRTDNGLRFGWAREYTASFAPISPAEIRQAFKEDLVGCQTRGPRIDLLGPQFRGYITSAYGRVITDELLRQNLDLDDHWWWGCNRRVGSMQEVDPELMHWAVERNVPVDDGMNGFVHWRTA